MSALDEQYKKCKYEIKRWEHEFKKREKRAPCKDDYKSAPDSVRDAYKRYWIAKTSLLEIILDNDYESEGSFDNRSEVENSTRKINLIEAAEVPPANIPNKDTVWGEHLEKAVEKNKESKFKKSSSFEFTQKLFKEVRLKKRNPRKSGLSIKQLKLPRTESMPIEIGSGTNKIEGDSQLLTPKDVSGDVIPESNSNIRVLQPKESAEKHGDIQFNFGTVKIIPGKSMMSVPSVGTLHVTNKLNDARSAFKSKFDEGWLERCQEKCTFNDSETTIENQVSAESNQIPQNETGIQCRDVDYTNIDCLNFDSSSDDDYIVSSDDERASKLRSSASTCTNLETEKPKEYEKRDELVEKSEELECSKSSKSTDSKMSSSNPIFSKRFGEELPHKTKRPRHVITTDDGKERKMKVLLKKLDDGSINDNFVAIDLKRKRYSRGKKFMSSSNYKVKQWKNKKKYANIQNASLGSSDVVLKCFRCGDVGHFMRQCKKQSTLLPLEDGVDDDDSPFPTLEEAAEMVKSKNMHNTEAALITEKFDEIEQPVSEDADNIKTVAPLYECYGDGSLIETPSEVTDALYEFGYENFRPGQEKVIMRLLSGKSTLMVSGTGSGKSLCYQLPAYLYAKRYKCLSLVISPLVSLMEDQVLNFPRPLKAACLHSNQPSETREKIAKKIENGEISVLLVSPETMISGEHGILGRSLVQNFPAVAFVCIDEAHCVSQWSHNFRTSYLIICKMLKERYNITTFLGLTATASKNTLSSITTHLGIDDGSSGIVHHKLLPDNLILSISKDECKDTALQNMLTRTPFCEFDSIIIYCLKREECERVARFLRINLQNFKTRTYENARSRMSADVEVYHAGLTAARRKRVQSNFMKGKLRIVVATVAFGMGINKADIRGIIHYNMPSTFEHYVQEIGRAGRDGLPARCHLFYNAEGKDLSELKRFIYRDSVDRTTLRKLLNRVLTTCSCQGICRKHEVVFPIEETIAELDIPQENISTLLCYLELLPGKCIEVLPLTYMEGTIISYNGILAMKRAAKKCPPLAFVIADHFKKNNTSNITASLQFPVIELADKIGWESGVLKRELKRCEWNLVDEKWKKTGISVSFEGLAFHVRSIGNVTEEERDAALENLVNRVLSQENTALYQLEICNDAFKSVAFDNVQDAIKSDEVSERNQKLKERIVGYFESENELPQYKQVERKINEKDYIISNIRQLVSNNPDCKFSARTIAKIFHGIDSPNFPAWIWTKSPYWRVGLNEDFNALRCLSSQELLKL